MEDDLPSDNDYKVKPIPGIAQIRSLVADEAKCYTFGNELNSEDDSEDQLRAINDLVSEWVVASVLGLEVENSEKKGVNENAEKDERIEPFPSN